MSTTHSIFTIHFNFPAFGKDSATFAWPDALFGFRPPSGADGAQQIFNSLKAEQPAHIKSVTYQGRTTNPEGSMLVVNHWPVGYNDAMAATGFVPTTKGGSDAGDSDSGSNNGNLIAIGIGAIILIAATR